MRCLSIGSQSFMPEWTVVRYDNILKIFLCEYFGPSLRARVDQKVAESAEEAMEEF